MKSVLISIQPKWVEKIASGEKTIEVRKTRPKIETPFKVYIYCTYGKANENYMLGKRGKVIGEFVCDRVDEYKAEFTNLHIFNAMKKDVCLNEVRRVKYYDEDGNPYYIYETSNEEENPNDCKLLKESCLTLNELRQYIGETFYDKSFYGWHISELKIYDKPKELSEFWTVKCTNKKGGCIGCEAKPSCIKTITKPLQSWCYVEENENER
jgi:hypothetical protein